jgi:MOSC domain-containing protein YiiM
MAKIVPLNVGLLRSVIFNGQVVTTGIFKEPTEGHVMLRRLNLDGDKQISKQI